METEDFALLCISEKYETLLLKTKGDFISFIYTLRWNINHGQHVCEACNMSVSWTSYVLVQMLVCMPVEFT